MSDGQPVNPEYVAEIVSSYVAGNQLPLNELPALIASVHRTLSELRQPPAPAAEPRIPAVPIRRSVQRDAVTCLECGWKGKMLRRHLGLTHGLSPVAYRAAWGLPANHPLTAPSYAELRGEMAKRFGLGTPRQTPPEA